MRYLKRNVLGSKRGCLPRGRLSVYLPISKTRMKLSTASTCCMSESGHEGGAPSYRIGSSSGRPAGSFTRRRGNLVRRPAHIPGLKCVIPRETAALFTDLPQMRVGTFAGQSVEYQSMRLLALSTTCA